MPNRDRHCGLAEHASIPQPLSCRTVPSHTMPTPRVTARSRPVPNSFRIGEFHVEPSLHSVSGPAGIVRLEAKVMQVLLCLAEHGNQVVPKERLMRAVWPDTFVSDDVLTRAISELRRVFGDDVRNPRFIQTIPKSGYRLMAPVSFSESGPTCRDSAGRPHRHPAVEARRLGRAQRQTVRASVLERGCVHGSEAWRWWRSSPPFCWRVSSPSGCRRRPLPESSARSGSPLPGRSPFHRSRRPSSRRSPPTAGGFTSR